MCLEQHCCKSVCQEIKLHKKNLYLVFITDAHQGNTETLHPTTLPTEFSRVFQVKSTA